MVKMEKKKMVEKKEKKKMAVTSIMKKGKYSQAGHSWAPCNWRYRRT